MPDSPPKTNPTLRPLLDLAFEDGRFRGLATELAGQGGPIEAQVASGLRAFLLAALLEAPYGPSGRPALLVTPDDRSARDLASDLRAYLGGERLVRHYPSRGTGYLSHIAPPPHLAGLRVAALDALASADAATVVVASAVALAEAVPDAELRPGGFSLSVGEQVDLADLAELLAAAGYERADQVTERGQFAVRGGILDVFPATEDRAVRAELFGDEVESLRWFSTFTQRSLGDTDRVELAPAAELSLEHREPVAVTEHDERPDLANLLPIDRFGAPLDLVPKKAFVAVVGHEDLAPVLHDHWEDVTAAMHADDARHLYVDVSDALAARAELRIAASTPDDEDEFSFRAQRPASPARSLREAETQLAKLTGSGYRTVVAFEHRGEAERARYNLRSDPEFLGHLAPEEASVRFAEARLREGFVSPELKLAVIPSRSLVHARRSAEPTPARGRLSAAIELRVGDFVVHEDHGVARFAGFDTKTVAGVTRDYLELEYRGEDRVFAPTDQFAKISRYVGVGAGDGGPQLSQLGGKRWQNLKARARRAAHEMAGELINLYAERRVRRGHEFAPDGEWQTEFEHAFPYVETADQLDAIEAVKSDMESERPMDRLICGDVGYGKTEVALRAAHKAATDGLQVMMLVPTTILAQQHFGTFKERFADTAFSVEMVSRLRKPAEQRETLKRFTDGKVDILIGTHRLLSRDVRGKQLGLMIVDEEQRFGVKQKELLRQLKMKVDVLSLSATPIPRTLQMSLAGLRDISVIETPPEGRRPVRTYVGPYDEDLIKRAIDREVGRGGQVFFLHNLIETLDETLERLQALCPGAKFAAAHGQMGEEDLESTMLSFLRGDIDVLVTTTIIESGLDIPTANTLIVERADQLGLAQAYQIRGRVGRSRERAFAYLLYPSPETLSTEASARLATLADNTELGSGFRVAMRDLEIRGAGNLLGDEQSGHVAAVGFELYVQMLEQATEELRAEVAEEGEEAAAEAPEPLRIDVEVDAYVPAEYVPYEAAKIDVHRRLAAARERGELAELRAELEDRFGPVPDPVGNLIELQRARIELASSGARSAEFRGGRLSVTGVELDSEAVSVLREHVSEARYEWRTQTASVRVPEEPGARLAALLALADAIAAAKASLAAAA